MVDDLPSAGTRGGRQVGKIVFLIAVIFAAVAVIAEFGIRRPDPKPERSSLRRELRPLHSRASRSGSQNMLVKTPAWNAIPANPHCTVGRGTPEHSCSPSEARS